MGLFKQDFFIGNRRRLRELFVGTAPILVTANGLLQRTGDINYPFTQDANFWYLSGLDIPDSMLLLYKDKEYVIIPEVNEYSDTFNGGVNKDKIKEQSGIDTILEGKEGDKLIDAILKKSRHVASLAPPKPYLSTYGMYTNPSRAALIRRIRNTAPHIEILDLNEHLTTMRFVKQSPEVEAIKNAVGITAKTLSNVHKRHYDYEYELEADITRRFRISGAVGHAYDPIVASGKNATILHYADNNCKINDGALILADVGAQYDHYGADITRTWSQSKATPRQQAVLSAVNDSVEYCLSELRAGVVYWDVMQDLRRYVGEKLRELGLVKTIDEESVSRYYPHSSHYLGLNTHDVGDYRAPLLAGVVLTIEPGIYIKEESIGVRIEEDVLITEDGYENLSANLPREL